MNFQYVFICGAGLGIAAAVKYRRRSCTLIPINYTLSSVHSQFEKHNDDPQKIIKRQHQPSSSQSVRKFPNSANGELRYQSSYRV